MAMLELLPVPPFPEGMNLQAKMHALTELQARYLQDIVLDKENEMNRRGPMKPAAGLPSTATDRAIGIVSAQDMNDLWRTAVMHGTAASSKLAVLSTDFTTKNDISYGTADGVFFDSAKRYKYATSPFVKGGTLIGVQNFAERKSNTSLILWSGAGKDNYTTGTVTVAQDSTAVTTGGGAAFTGNIEEGMYLYAGTDLKGDATKQYIGQVVSFTNTTLTLVEGALFAATAKNYVLRSTRNLEHHVSKGQITCTVGNTRVDGSNTKFKRQNLDAGGPWALFRADDMKYIGKVTSVQSDIQLTLTAAANATCNKNEFVAIDMTGDRSIKIANAFDFGFITGSFANRQWYANNPISNKNQPNSSTRVWFSQPFDPEAVDHTSDGDHILIPNDKPPLHSIVGLLGTPSCLMVFKEDETWGVFGTDGSNFSPRKLHDDGALSPMCIEQWEGGVVWAGKRGIWFFDGNEVFPLIDDRIGDWYGLACEFFPSRTFGAFSMLYRGNYFLHIEKATPPFGPDKTANDTNSPSGTPMQGMSLCINLERRAVTTLTNFAFLGGVESTMEALQSTMFVVNKMDDGAAKTLTGWRLCLTKDILDSFGIDTINTDHPAYAGADRRGPDMFIESGRRNNNDPQWKTRWKQLQMHMRIDSISGDYVALGNVGAGATDLANNSLKFATMVGLNDMGTVSNGEWRITRAKNSAGVYQAAYQNKRLKFNKRSQYIGFKIWQKNLTGIKRVSFGPGALAFKPMRKGRV